MNASEANRLSLENRIRYNLVREQQKYEEILNIIANAVSAGKSSIDVLEHNFDLLTPNSVKTLIVKGYKLFYVSERNTSSSYQPTLRYVTIVWDGTAMAIPVTFNGVDVVINCFSQEIPFREFTKADKFLDKRLQKEVNSYIVALVFVVAALFAIVTILSLS